MLTIGVIAHLRHAIKEPYAGGLEMHTHLLCRRLRELGHEVRLFAAEGSEHPGLEAVCGPVPLGNGSFMQEHRRYYDLMKALAGRSFDIIHNNSLHYLPVAMAGTLPMPMITTLHTPPFWELEGSIRLHPTSHHSFVAVSDAIRRAWQPIVPAAQVVPNGVDLEQFTFCEFPDAEPYGIWYGRIVPEKGLHLAIDAARRAGLALRFAGPIADRAYYTRHVAPRIDGNVRYLGHLSHAALAAAIGGARVFLCTPMWDEPYGLVIAEALGCGTPVAAFARGAVPDLLDATCGVLVRPNDVDALAAATRSAQNLDRSACRIHARVIGDVATMMNRYESLYVDMIHRYPRTCRKNARASPVASMDPSIQALVDAYMHHAPAMLCPLPYDSTVACLP